jgi:hypothetical protein
MGIFLARLLLKKSPEMSVEVDVPQSFEHRCREEFEVGENYFCCGLGGARLLDMLKTC